MTHGVELRDIQDPGQFNQNLCFTACQISDERKAIEMIEFVVSMGCDLFQKDNLKQTPLYYAARAGHSQLVAILIESGLEVDSIDTYGQNPIYYSVNSGHLAATQMLQSFGSDHDIVDENGQTPLYYAIKSNKPDVLEYLLKLGCNLNIVDKRGGLTPVNFAVRQNKPLMKELLIKYGATPPPDPKQKKAQEKAKTIVPAQPVKKVNERLIPKEFVLQILDKGHYRPITDEEFDLLK